MLRRQVVIQRKAAGSPAQNSLGEPNYSWVTFATVYAAVQPLRGREFFEAGQRHGTLDTKITLRFLPGVDEAMRVVDGSLVYNLVAPPIDVDLRHVELQLMCLKGAGDG